MKKPKLSLNFGEGGFQGWLLRHCEKMILGVVILLALWVIWGGYGLSGLENEKSPEKLRNAAQQKRTTITATSWEEFKSNNKERDLPQVDTQSVAVKVEPGLWRLNNRWNPPDFPQLTKRADPEIYPPIQLKTVPMVGALAYQQTAGYTDELEAASVPAEPRRPAASGGTLPGVAGALPGRGTGRRRGRNRDPMGMDPMGIGGPMGDGMDAAGGVPEMAATGGMGDDGMAPGADMGMEMGLGAAASGEQLTGYRPPQNAIAKTRHGVVLMALVQHEKQFQEFERALADSLDPDPRRDQPTYLTFFVQRVDVTEDPNVDPSSIPDDAWESIRVNDSLKDAANWAGFPRDILNPSYLMLVNPLAPAAQRIGLTHPLPPFMQRDLWDAMTHPEIPLASAARQMPTNAAPSKVEEEESGDVIPGGVPGGGGMRAGGMMPGAMMPGMAGGMDGGMMAGGMPGMDGGMMAGGMPGMDGGMMAGGMPGMDGGMMAGGMPGMDGGMMAGGMPGMDGGMMPGMMPGMMGGSYAPQTKYKLIRMTDFSVEPGRKYRYRVKVVLDDPNNPRMTAAPSPAALADDVVDRLKTEKGQLKYVESKEWSAPSEVVSMPSAEWFYAGAVDNDAGQVLVDGTRPVRREPSAKAVAVKHDPTKGADIPTEQTVYRGTTFNLKADVDVIHPVKGQFRTLKDYELRTDAVVADILGGETIPLVNKDRDEKMTAPGELLIIDADGNLLVQDESEDIMEFRRYAPDEEATAAPAADYGIPGGMEAPPGGEDIPGGAMPMGRRRGR